MIKTVFLDMDGVITDFQKGVYDAFKQPYDYTKLPRRYDFWLDWPNREINRPQINAICDTNFWANLPWTHDGKQILDVVLKKFDITQIYLLTVPMSNVYSPTGKWIWVTRNIPELYNKTIITQAPKALLAQPTTLLIDDHDSTIDEFYAAGGQACLVPRPWNRNHFYADRTVDVVEKFLEDLK